MPKKPSQKSRRKKTRKRKAEWEGFRRAQAVPKVAIGGKVRRLRPASPARWLEQAAERRKGGDAPRMVKRAIAGARRATFSRGKYLP